MSRAIELATFLEEKREGFHILLKETECKAIEVELRRLDAVDKWVSDKVLDALDAAMNQWASYYSEANSDDIARGSGGESAAYRRCLKVKQELMGG